MCMQVTMRVKSHHKECGQVYAEKDPYLNFKMETLFFIECRQKSDTRPSINKDNLQ